MGLFGFGKKKSITINVPPPPKLPTAEELFSAGTAQAKSTSPLAFGARESALSDLSRGNDFYNQFSLTGRPLGEITPDYFNQFGPTTLEQALGTQYFQNVMPDIERSIKHNLSLSGIANSPALADLIARERGKVGFDVGSYLANQAQRRGELGLARESELAGIGEQRAINSLNYRDIDPFSMITPFVQTGMYQSQAQAKMDNDYNIMKAQFELQNAIQAQQNKGAFGSTIGSILGGGAGFLLSGFNPGGAALGASLGGSAGNAFAGGGSQTPIGFGDALSAYQTFNPNNTGFLQGYGRNTPKRVYNTGNQSILPLSGRFGRDYSMQDYIGRYGINPGY